MALNLNAEGKELGPLIKKYDWRDVILYALGTGAGFDEPDYCYEKNLKVIPAFGATAVFELFFHAATTANVNMAGILHGEQAIVFHAPFPTSGALTSVGKIESFYDLGKGKGAVIIVTTESHHTNGDKIFSGRFSIFARFDGGFDGKAPPRKTFRFPESPPDAVADASPSKDQPLLFRLSGDTFALHADPEFARQSGFRGPIMHGLCTYGYACRALTAALVPGAPERVRRFECRFARPLYPGIPIQTRIWKTETGEALWQTVNAETGEVVLTNGIFAYQ